MSEDDKQLELPTFFALITGVVREGAGLVMTLSNVRRWPSGSWRRKALYTATIRFSNARRIVSQYALNETADCRLEPGWQFGGSLRFDGIGAALSVQYVDMPSHIIATVLHRIYCDAVTMTTRLDLGETVKRYFFPRTAPHVIIEPAACAPLEGQERPRPPVPERETIY